MVTDNFDRNAYQFRLASGVKKTKESKTSTKKSAYVVPARRTSSQPNVEGSKPVLEPTCYHCG